MKKMLAISAGGLLFAGYLCLPTMGADAEKPKYSIEDVMKKGMNPKTGLLKKVQAGEASDEEKATLHEMFVALAANEPPKGDAESWKKKTGALVRASKSVVDGTEGAMEKLKKAANCKACHAEHKPE